MESERGDEGDCARRGTKSGRGKRGELDGDENVALFRVTIQQNTRTPRHPEPRHSHLPSARPLPLISHSIHAACGDGPSDCFATIMLQLSVGVPLGNGTLLDSRSDETRRREGCLKLRKFAIHEEDLR
jgi:hypothetical protein